ncbi:MAG: hypothetical protein V2A76_17215 [Planctomycetota bacterium]
MAKPIVVSGDDLARIPFLRGILTRSLQDFGLSFEDSYKIATEIREKLSAKTEITDSELRQMVAARLAEFDQDLSRRYSLPRKARSPVLIQLEGGQSVPFSRGHHRVEFESCGLDPERAQAVAERLYRDLLGRAGSPVPLKELRHLTYKTLQASGTEEIARRYVAWVEFQKNDRPLLVLLGGSAGTGKSSIAAQLAHRLEIVRTQSTDMLREVMRMMLPSRLLPVLHRSSFDAWKELPGIGQEAEMLGTELASGYMTQTELISVAADAVIQRALKERVSLILEGVHVHPLLLERIPENSDVILVPLLLAVLDAKTLRSRLKGRASQVPGRRSRRYLEHFDEIWRLQSFLLSEADWAGIPIISNTDKEHALGQVMAIIMDTLTRSFTGTPEEVF